MTKLAKPAGSWKLIKASFAELRRNWRLYLAIMLIVELPLRLIGLSSQAAADPTFVTYSSILTLVLDLALLSAVLAISDGQKISMRQAYYDGTAAFVRYALTVISFALIIAVPAALALIVFYVGILTAGSAIESWIFIILAGALALPVVLLIGRLGFAAIGSVKGGLRPWAALSWSWKLTRRRTWLFAGRYLMLLLWMLLVALVFAVPMIILGTVIRDANILNDIYQLGATTILLPLITIYSVKLYSSLETVIKL